MSPGLTGHEFVGHVFVLADGRRGTEAYAWIRERWNALGPAFGIEHALGSYPSDPPAQVPAVDGLLAVRRATTGSGRQEAVLRRTHDTLCLSVLRAPGGGPCWDTLDAEWGVVFPSAPGGLIGSVRILQACLDDPAAPLDPVALGPAVRWALSTPGPWPDGGSVQDAAPFGPFCVWEAPDPPGGPVEHDGRAERRIVVLAAHDRGRPLSRWTWVNGTDLPVFAHYLLHAAKVRYERRVWAGDTGRALRTRTDAAVRPLLELARDLAEHGREPAPDALLAASVPLVRLQGGEAGLVDRASRLRSMRLSVEIASNNMATFAGGQDAGLFRDDRDAAVSLTRQLDIDAAVLDGAAERARNVAALGDQLVQRGLTARQERFNLGLTGVVGAVLMALAAIQSFQIEALVPPQVQLPLVTVLAAFALLVAMIVLRLAGRRRAGAVVALAGSAAALGAAAGWLVGAAVPTGPPVLWAAIGGAVVGVAAVAIIERRS